ncbi:hypothetical protein OG21DRAFT_1525741 [Imleria badia]|nr:hypothetical protein OG21DRAFT_1525741 [Imleria badia]
MRRHIPDNTTEPTLDMGVNTIYSCKYQTFKCIVKTSPPLFQSGPSGQIGMLTPDESLEFLPSICEILYISNVWAFLLFLGAANLAMILRVWVMYNRSRIILTTLLIMFSAEVVCTIVVAAMWSDPRITWLTTMHILDVTMCMVEFPLAVWTKAATILEIMISTTMCTLAIGRFITQSLQMYRVTKQWQLSRYMNLLVQQGIVYFLAVSLFSIMNAVNASKIALPGGWGMVLLLALQSVPMYTLAPRFILGIREMYARDVQGRRGEGIDTGFGLSLAGGGAVGMELGFLDAEENEGSEGIGEIPIGFGMPRPE